MIPRTACLRRDRRGATALEFALVFPSILLMLLGLMMFYTLIATKRAVDYGIEKALRSAAVNSAGGAAAVTTAYANAAGAMWAAARTPASITVQVSAGGTGTMATATTFAPGDTVKVIVTYNWVAATSLAAPFANKMFTPSALSADGAVRVIN